MPLVLLTEITIRDAAGNLVPIGTAPHIEFQRSTRAFLIEDDQARRFFIALKRTPRYLALRQQLKLKGRPGWRRIR